VTSDEKRQALDRRQGDRRQNARRDTDASQLGSMFLTECIRAERNNIGLLKAIGKLSLNQRTATLAHEYGGLTLEETALAMNTSLWTVKHHLRRARVNMLKRMHLDESAFQDASEESIQELLGQHAQEILRESTKQNELSQKKKQKIE